MPKLHNFISRVKSISIFVWEYLKAVQHEAAFGHIRTILNANLSVFGQALLPVRTVSAAAPLTCIKLLPYCEEELLNALVNIENGDFLSGLNALFDGV